MLGDIGIGAQSLARGIRLLNRPGIRIYVVVPLLINLLLFGTLIWYGYSQFTLFVAWLMSFVPGFLDFLEWLIWLFFGVLAADGAKYFTLALVIAGTGFALALGASQVFQFEPGTSAGMLAAFADHARRRG